jgi:hypothetical protein
LNCPQGVRRQKGSIRDSFCSKFLEGAVRHSAVQGVRRPGRSLRVAILSQYQKTVVQVCAESRETEHLMCCWVATRSACKKFSKGLEKLEKLRRSRPSNLLKDKCREASIESLQEHRRLASGRTSLCERST